MSFPVEPDTSHRFKPTPFIGEIDILAKRKKHLLVQVEI